MHMRLRQSFGYLKANKNLNYWHGYVALINPIKTLVILFSGDPTEDPVAPKVLWPTKENCPKCRVPEEEYGVVFFA